MISTRTQIRTIASKEIRDAIQAHLLTLLTVFLALAALTSLIVSAIAMHAEFVSYNESRDLLISLGKSASSLVPPAFFPLKLLRGFIEHIEIIGAVLGIVLGYRSAAIERGHATLALILTRPLSQFTFLLGKLAGNAALIATALAITFAVGGLALAAITGVGLNTTDVMRIVLVYASACFYVTSFFLLGFILALTIRRLPTALLSAFSIWLMLVLIAPQIGDTMDPDNQVAGGVFKKLEIAKPLELQILGTFKSYETIRDAIEEASPAKHFERFSFAILGIKDIFNGQPILDIMKDRMANIWSMLGIFAALLGLLFFRPLNITRLIKE